MTNRHFLRVPGMSPMRGVAASGMLLAIACGLSLTAGGTAAEKKTVEKKTVEKKTGEVASNADGAKADKPPLGQIKVLVPTKTFKREGSAKAARVDFNDIDIELVLNTKKLSLDLPSQMPEWLKKLDGQRIRLRGFMHPQSAFQDKGIKRFVLCRDTSACCFGPNPTVYYLVETTLKSGTSTNYIDNKAFDVEGIFRIKPTKYEGTDEVDQFYFLDDAQVLTK